MSREIRYRVKKADGSGWAYINGVGHEHWYSDGGRFYGDINEETITQYTGLKDKNGKEIYEGDVVYLDGDMIVVSYGIQCIDAFETVGFNLVDFYGDYKDRGQAKRLQSRLSVIGNIYENSELVEAKDEEAS